MVPVPKLCPDLATLRAVLAPRRAAGARVVFTNGCFDLLHTGHVRYLTAARGLGDLLVVGLNDDASVRRLKGEGRPVLMADERAEVLAALAAVDHVIVFSEDTPRALIAALAPDVLVKGADWAADDIVGREEVLAAGGRVERITLVPGVSTSELIRRIQYPTRHGDPTRPAGRTGTPTGGAGVEVKAGRVPGIRSGRRPRKRR